MSVQGGADKKALTINLPEKEMRKLDALAEEKGMSKTALVRQALRLYESVQRRVDCGEKLFFEDPIRGDKAELVVL